MGSDSAEDGRGWYSRRTSGFPAASQDKGLLRFSRFEQRPCHARAFTSDPPSLHKNAAHQGPAAHVREDQECPSSTIEHIRVSKLSAGRRFWPNHPPAAFGLEVVSKPEIAVEGQAQAASKAQSRQSRDEQYISRGQKSRHLAGPSGISRGYGTTSKVFPRVGRYT